MWIREERQNFLGWKCVRCRPSSCLRAAQWDFCGCYGASVLIAFMIERNDISPGRAHSYIYILQINFISSLIEAIFWFMMPGKSNINTAIAPAPAGFCCFSSPVSLSPSYQHSSSTINSLRIPQSKPGLWCRGGTYLWIVCVCVCSAASGDTNAINIPLDHRCIAHM